MLRPWGESICNFKIQKFFLCFNRLRIFNFDNDLLQTSLRLFFKTIKNNFFVVQTFGSHFDSFFCARQKHMYLYIWVTLLSWVTVFKKLNKLFNAYLKKLVNWLNANKTSLNAKKDEVVIFKFKQKKFEGDLKVRLWAKRLCTTERVKYLVVQIDSNLNWESQVNDLCLTTVSFLKSENMLVLKY